MKRIKITESQYNLVKLLKEDIDFAEITKGRINDIKKSANKLYSNITFSTIAEIRDGDLDIGIIERNVDTLEDKLTNIELKISDYFKRYDEDTYYEKKLDDVQYELEKKVNIVSAKLSALYNIVQTLSAFPKTNEYGDERENDWDKPFDDITSIEI